MCSAGITGALPVFSLVMSVTAGAWPWLAIQVAAIAVVLSCR